MESIARIAASWTTVTLVIALAALILFRRPLATHLTYLTQVDGSLKGITAKFATAKPIPFENYDIRRQFPASGGIPSKVEEIWGYIAREASEQSIWINLGEGNDWLTSRLFILTILLRQYRDTKVVVFTEAKPKLGHFVGWAETGRVATALQTFYPYLADAWRVAQRNAAATPIPQNSWEPNPLRPQLLVWCFLNGLRSQDEPPGISKHEWVYMEKEEATFERTATEAAWERASWVTPATLQRMLGSFLVTNKMRIKAKSDDASVKATLLHKEPFVAAVTPDGCLKGLVDRLGLADQYIRQTFARE